MPKIAILPNDRLLIRMDKIGGLVLATKVDGRLNGGYAVMEMRK